MKAKGLVYYTITRPILCFSLSMIGMMKDEVVSINDIIISDRIKRFIQRGLILYSRQQI